jgi:tripartite-type tricarboxylate transporter receptor subunit TctC
MATRRDTLTALAVAAFGSSLARPAGAQAGGASLPAGTIRLVVGFPPGGITDSIGRLAADALGQGTGRTVIVENKPGAGGNIGAVSVVRAEPNGLTLYVGTPGTHAINHAIYKDTGFDPIRDFVPVAHIATSANVLIANPQFPAKNLRELIDAAKTASAPLAMAIPSIGAVAHLAAELLATRAGVKFNMVPYKGGAPALSDLMAGVVPLLFESAATAKPHIDAGKVRALGLTSTTRSAILPDVPPISDTFPGYEAISWWGVFAPAQTPPAVAASLQAGFAQGLANPAVSKKFEQLGTALLYLPGAELGAKVKVEFDKWGAIIRDGNIKVQ